MLNFNAMENVNSYSIPVNNSNFIHSVGQSMSSASLHTNMTYMQSNSRGQTSDNWSSSVRIHNSPNETIDNNNLSSQNDSICLESQKEYRQTVINENENTDRSTMNMENYIQQKGSENVKRFSVNNLLQLANNCRALANEHRIAVGKSNLISIL